MRKVHSGNACYCSIQIHFKPLKVYVLVHKTVFHLFCIALNVVLSEMNRVEQFRILYSEKISDFKHVI